jgi:hypothetical protein
MGSKCCAENEKADKFALGVAIRVFGGLLVLFSIVELGVGGTAYTFLTNVKLGGWWGAILTLVAGVLGLVYKPKSVIISAIVISIFGIIIALVAASVDVIAAEILRQQACISSTGTVSGTHISSFDIIKSYNSAQAQQVIQLIMNLANA